MGYTFSILALKHMALSPCQRFFSRIQNSSDQSYNIVLSNKSINHLKPVTETILGLDTIDKSFDHMNPGQNDHSIAIDDKNLTTVSNEIADRTSLATRVP